jgi:nonsense-mediated mRNA decay protein 3
LKHGAYDKVLKVTVEDDGINFYYKNTTHAQRLIDFLGSLYPITVKNSKQLISHDQSSNVFVYKYAFAVTLPKICKNDLVIIPKKLAKELGGCSQLLLCEKVAETMGFIDLMSFNYVLMSSMQYYYYEKDIQMLNLSRYKRSFEILDCNPVDRKDYHKIKSTLNKYSSRIYYYNITKCG